MTTRFVTFALQPRRWTFCNLTDSHRQVELRALETRGCMSDRVASPRKTPPYSTLGDDMTVTRLIVKYPNRRMYDLNESRYITLDDIRAFVIARDEIKITDRNSRLDITNHILLKVIAEQEDRDEPVLSREFLLQTILSYGIPHGQGQRVSGTDPDVVRSPPARLLSNSP